MTDLSNRQPWVVSKRVLPQHTDHAGVMWHGSYVAWLEEARVEALDKAGVSYGQLASMGFEMPVVGLKVNYFKALFHGAEVHLESWALANKGVRWPWFSRFIQEDNDVVAEAYVDLVLVKTIGEGFKPKVVRKPPEQISKVLKRLQKGPEILRVKNS